MNARPKRHAAGFVITLAFAVACAAPLRTPSPTQVRASTDGGETWADVTKAGSAVGTVALVGDERQESYWVQVTRDRIFEVSKADVSTPDRATLYKAFASEPSIDVTMTWDAAGRIVSVR